jgi:hypothetical protein
LNKREKRKSLIRDEASNFFKMDKSSFKSNRTDIEDEESLKKKIIDEQQVLK